jgi:hypothetical protein
MWLRHFLSKDLPHCRTMIYGYDSKISLHAFNTTMDYARGLIEEIKKIRNSSEVSYLYSTNNKYQADGRDLRPTATAASLFYHSQLWWYSASSCMLLARIYDYYLMQYFSALSKQFRYVKTVIQWHPFTRRHTAFSSLRRQTRAW